MCTCLSALLLSSHCSLCSSRWEERQNSLGPSDGGKWVFRSHTQKHTFKETEQQLNSTHLDSFSQNLFKEPNHTVNVQRWGHEGAWREIITPNTYWSYLWVCCLQDGRRRTDLSLKASRLCEQRHKHIQMTSDNRFVLICSVTVTSHVNRSVFSIWGWQLWLESTAIFHNNPPQKNQYVIKQTN